MQKNQRLNFLKWPTQAGSKTDPHLKVSSSTVETNISIQA